MAKQTFTTGQVLLASQLTSLQQTAMLGGSASNKTSSYTLVAADAGTAISMTSTSATTITVNTGLFAAGDTVQITNLGSGVSTITAGSATVNTSASLALAQYESGTLDFTSTSAAIFIKGAGAAAASGGMTLLDTLTLSGTTVTSSTFSSAYKGLRIYVKNLVSNNNAAFNFRMNGDTASNYSWVFYNNGFAAESMSATSLRIFNITNQTTVLKAANAIIDIMRPEDTDQVFLTYTSLTGATGTAMEQFLGQGIYDSSAAITSVSFISSPQTMTSGTAFIYGVN